MFNGINICKIKTKNGKFKYPKLNELHSHYFNADIENAHHALVDAEATAKCYVQMINDLDL